MVKTTWDAVFLGDSLGIFNLVAALAYMAMVLIVTNRDDAATIFDPLWLREGFCVTNRDAPFSSSHDMCLYADTVMAVLIAVAYFSLRSKRSSFENEFVGGSIFGVLGHGLTHGFLAHLIRQDKPIQSFRDEETMTTLWMKLFVGTWIFWGPLLKSVLPRVSFRRLVPFAFVVNAGGLAIPPIYGVMYVQTILLCVSSARHLMRPREEKNVVAYPIYSLASLMIIFAALVESTQCKYIIKWGGHVWYDMSIALAIFVPYLFLPNTTTVVDSPSKKNA